MRTLDRLRSGRGYSNRSEFVRDLLRGELVKKEWEDQAGETVGVLVRVYDHDTRALAGKLTDIQRSSLCGVPPGMSGGSRIVCFRSRVCGMGSSPLPRLARA